MTAALRKFDSPQPRRSRQRVAAKNSHNQVTYLPSVSPAGLSGRLDRAQGSTLSATASPINTSQRSRKVANLTNAWAKPMWLRSLLGMNRAIAIVTLILVSGVLGVYSQVVYTKQNWGQEYRQLERLQKEERQIAAFNEALKHNIAQTAKQEGTGLVTPDSNYMIVLEPAPVNPSPENSSLSPEKFQTQQPLGY